MSYQLSQQKKVRFRHVHYPVYKEELIFRDGSDEPTCPRCGHEAGAVTICQFEQDGFWVDVFVTCVECLSCHKPYAVRVIVDVPKDERYPEPTVTLPFGFPFLNRSGLDEVGGYIVEE